MKLTEDTKCQLFPVHFEYFQNINQDKQQR